METDTETDIKTNQEELKEDEKLLNRIFDYILSIRKKNEDIPVVEAITDFCFKYDYEVEDVGCLIGETVWFKNFVQNDCTLNDSENKVEDW